ncbi:hypothetical protein HK405_004859 [Cladochytrium tenue]|nr:hypothetical protein HK405_004859 [Cladochytrium tenue]
MPASQTTRERRDPPPRQKSCAATRTGSVAVAAAASASSVARVAGISGRHSRHGEAIGQPIPDEGNLASSVALALPLMEIGDDGLIRYLDTPDSNAEIQLDSDQNRAEDQDPATTSSFDAWLSDFDQLHQPSPDGHDLALGLKLPLAMSAYDLDFVAECVAKRLRFALDEIKTAPATMVTSLQTPWSHPQLYRYSTPLSMQEALAHLHSLLLYEIICLLDGDLAARAAAERAIPAVETAATGLLVHVKWHGTDANENDYSLDGTTSELVSPSIAYLTDFWSSWIFQESARRTILLTFYFLHAYRIITGMQRLECDVRLALCQSWTLSARLWNAESVHEFGEAWKTAPRFVVRDSDFSIPLREAGPEDFDAFGRMMISSWMGIAEAEAWFASRGGSLGGKDSVKLRHIPA